MRSRGNPGSAPVLNDCPHENYVSHSEGTRTTALVSGAGSAAARVIAPSSAAFTIIAAWKPPAAPPVLGRKTASAVGALLRRLLGALTISAGVMALIAHQLPAAVFDTSNRNDDVVSRES